MIDEERNPIEEFPDYQVSNCGHVFKVGTDFPMSVSYTAHGHAKITLSDGGERKTRSVALIVAQAFVEPPHPVCDHVMVLNGDHHDLRAENLVWRPRHFVWHYARQFKVPVPVHCETLPVIEVQTGRTWDNIVEASIECGLLMDDVWRSTYTGDPVFPLMTQFRIID